MEKLFAIFICVALLAFLIVPLLAVKNSGKSDDDEGGAGRRSKGRKTSRRKRGKDSVSAKVKPVRKTAGQNGAESTYHLGIAEYETSDGTDKSYVVDEDIDSFIVTGSLSGRSAGGFEYSNRRDVIYPDCCVIKKTAVKSYYKDLSETKYFYKGQPVQYVEKAGETTIEVYDGPASFLKEFSSMEMGGGGKSFKKYFKAIDPEDPDLRKETEHINEALSINTYGLEPGLGKKEYEEILVRYLTEKMAGSGAGKDGLRRLLLGIYGYRFPDDGLFTNIDIVFDRVIPLRYRQLDDNSKSRANFRGELINAIMTGYRMVGCKYGYTLVDDNRSITPSPEYSYYICLVLHLMLMKYHKAGKRPYVELDLSNVWSRLEEGVKKINPLDDHNPVYHGEYMLCENLGEFTMEALKKLVYFKQFEKEKIDKNVTE